MGLLIAAGFLLGLLALTQVIVRRQLDTNQADQEGER